jgi:hypothetical protein
VRRMWPDDYASLLDTAEEVEIDVQPLVNGERSSGKMITRKALKAVVSQQDFEKIWPLAEARYRLAGRFSGKAITLITNNPHYQPWHPADGGSVESVSDSGTRYTTRYVVVHFLLDEVRETVEA